LSISLGIARSHGGSLSLRPSQTGACFRLSLPLAAAPGASPGPASPAPAAAARHALVADDESGIRSLLEQLLLRRGYRVDLAEDGEQARRFLDETSPGYTVVFCDVRMPKLSGLELYALAGAERCVSGRFVLITGNAVSEQVEAFARAHGIPLLLKPFTGGDLDAVLASSGREASPGFTGV
jgi:DNA-binding NtrC family response regulator